MGQSPANSSARRRMAALAAATAVGVGIAACGGSASTPGGASAGGGSSSGSGSSSGGSYTIGFLLDKSGTAAFVGQEAQEGAELAINQINASGGVNGKKLVGDYQDTQLQPTLAVSEMNAMVDVKHLKLIVAQATPVLNAIKPLAKSDKVDVINHAGVDPTIADGPGYVFTTIATAAQEAPPLAKYMVSTDHVKTMATLTDNSAIGESAGSAMKSAFTADGGKVVDQESFVEGTATDFTPELVKVKQANPQALFIEPNGPQMTADIVKQIKQVGLHVKLYSDTFFEDPSVPKLAGSLANGVIYSYAGFNPKGSSQAKKLQSEWNKSHSGVVPIYAATSYDAVLLYANAIKAVGYDGTKVRNYFLGGRSFQGATGDLKFDSKGQVEGFHVELKELKSGKFVILQGG